MADVFPRIAHEMGHIDVPEKLSSSGAVGIRWSYIGGESGTSGTFRHVAVDGIENVASVLEQVEDGLFDEIEYLELSACPGGCVGGVLNVADPYLARARIRAIRRSMSHQKNFLRAGEVPGYLIKKEKLRPISAMQLSGDLFEAMDMLDRIQAMRDQLPGLDCGSCGCPNCRSLAEDAVRGRKKLTDCVFYNGKAKTNQNVIVEYDERSD